MIEEERKPRAYMLRYDESDRMYVMCKPLKDGGYNQSGKKFDRERIFDRLVTAARLGDIVVADKDDASLARMIQKAYALMKGRPPVRDGKKCFTQGIQPG
ncbi:MAG: hypothetical protein QXT19_04165 [Candidatus Woesearchaeota archaeon]